MYVCVFTVPFIVKVSSAQGSIDGVALSCVESNITYHSKPIVFQIVSYDLILNELGGDFPEKPQADWLGILSLIFLHRNLVHLTAEEEIRAYH